ncbi:DUF4239 domain-containing protein [Candidatus Shapirobacteria bacterium]|nr:DUF4239 domain-containing protein [Candidatus Shapirobacteria bacterium]
MNKVILNSFLVSLVIAVISYFFRQSFHTDLYLSDVGGLSTFIGAFATLFGLLSAFVVFEVWGQYNKTALYVDKEASGLEQLYRLTLYFRDKKLNRVMASAITKYANMVIKGRFQKLGSGERNNESGLAFREISGVIQGIKFDDDHDQIIFDHIVSHYGDLSDIRTERINQSLARLPSLLKTFLYIASFFVVTCLVIMPFANVFYSLFAVFCMTFVIVMIYFLIEDLDNPFVGNWNISPEPFKRALKHIAQDYT